MHHEINGQIKLAYDFMASHEEADDGIMYSINQVFQRKNPETQNYNCLNNACTGKSVHVHKKGRIVSSKQQYELYPFHRILLQLGRPVINSLPESHSLAGCDTVTKWD